MLGSSFLNLGTLHGTAPHERDRTIPRFPDMFALGWRCRARSLGGKHS
jgi:hypothetical protein